MVPDMARDHFRRPEACNSDGPPHFERSPLWRRAAPAGGNGVPARCQRLEKPVFRCRLEAAHSVGAAAALKLVTHSGCCRRVRAARSRCHWRFVVTRPLALPNSRRRSGLPLAVRRLWISCARLGHTIYWGCRTIPKRDIALSKCGGSTANNVVTCCFGILFYLLQNLPEHIDEDRTPH
jgi:hypothetical protein